MLRHLSRATRGGGGLHANEEEGLEEGWRKEEIARGLEDGGTMPSAVCPACGKNIRIAEDQAFLYERIICPSCDADLEIIDENPIVLEEVED